MLLIPSIKENKDAFISGLQKRHFKNIDLLDHLLELDEERKQMQLQLDNVLAEANSLAKEIGVLIKENKVEEANQVKIKTTSSKEQSRVLQEKKTGIENKIKEILYKIPNIPHESVPEGKTPEENLVVFEQNEPITLPNNALPHWELAKKHDLIDFELGVKITGAGFPVYKGKGAKLQRSLINFFLDYNTNGGYGEINPPYLVNEASGFGTGQLPDKEGQMYHVGLDNLFLIPTAEVPVTNIFRDVLLEEKQLPIALTAYTPCFRREAGSYGKDVRGLNRLHQFDKVEIVRIEKPENSYLALDLMVEHVKSLLTILELPFRILKLCGGDMGFTSALTYDFEVYSTAQEKWLEVSSVSNFETFQANRLKLKFRSNGKTEFCHTLNGSSLALPRIMAALLENNQMEDGKIKIPAALAHYTTFTVI
ncbi:MAG: serine--tRNA ligase [Solirubrobacteraceae bacterium]